ncbi:MAG: hypothetical protein ING19_17355 [Azospirillum sp.]|nr:hypothetical protein [Azospirillum sp.]
MDLPPGFPVRRAGAAIAPYDQYAEAFRRKSRRNRATYEKSTQRRLRKSENVDLTTRRRLSSDGCLRPQSVFPTAPAFENRFPMQAVPAVATGRSKNHRIPPEQAVVEAAESAGRSGAGAGAGAGTETGAEAAGRGIGDGIAAYSQDHRTAIVQAAIAACAFLGIDCERVGATLDLSPEAIEAIRTYGEGVRFDDETVRRALFVVDVFESLEGVGFEARPPMRRSA